MFLGRGQGTHPPHWAQEEEVFTERSIGCKTEEVRQVWRFQEKKGEWGGSKVRGGQRGSQAPEVMGRIGFMDTVVADFKGWAMANQGIAARGV